MYNRQIRPVKVYTTVEATGKKSPVINLVTPDKRTHESRSRTTTPVKTKQLKTTHKTDGPVERPVQSLLKNLSNDSERKDSEVSVFCAEGSARERRNITEKCLASYKTEKDIVNLVSFNCKNIKTCGYVLEEIFKTTDIVLLQEHWLFHNQLDQINDICENICYAAKGVDMSNPVLPTQMPRGYGGIAIIRKKIINHLIHELPEGNERTQCVELKEANGNKFLVVSVYLPAKGGKMATEDYLDCIQQLYDILQTLFYNTWWH